MGIFVPRHKCRVEAMFPPKQISIFSLKMPHPSYEPSPDHLSRFLTYLLAKPHKIKKTSSYLLAKFEKCYFKTLDYVACFVTLSIIEHILLQLHRYISSFCLPVLAILFSCISAVECTALQVKAIETFSLFCKMLGSTSHLRRMGFVDRYAKNHHATMGNTSEKPSGMSKKSSKSLLTARLQILSTAVNIDNIFKPFSPASIFYSILALIASFILQPCMPQIRDSASSLAPSPRIQGGFARSAHQKFCSCCQGSLSEAVKYQTDSSVYLHKLPILPSRSIIAALSKKLYKRSKKFRGSMYMHLLQPSPSPTLLQSTSLNMYPNVILIEDWRYLLSFNSIYVKIGEIYFPNEMFVTCSGEFDVVFTCFFELLRRSENNFIAFMRYFMLRMRNIQDFKFPQRNHHVIEGNLGGSIFEMPIANGQATQEPPVLGHPQFKDTDATSRPHEALSSSFSSSPAFTLRSTDLEQELVEKRFKFITLLAPITMAKMICKYAVQFEPSFITTLIEEIRIGIDKISLVSPNRSQPSVIQMDGSLLASSSFNSLLFEASMFSILCQLLGLIREISALVPGLIKTCIVQLLRLSRLESSQCQKNSPSVCAIPSQGQNYHTHEKDKGHELNGHSDGHSDEHSDDGNSDPAAITLPRVSSPIFMRANYSFSSEAVFVFDGSLFVLKSEHLMAKLICCLLSSILSHSSVVKIRQEMYSYFIGRLLNSPSTTSSSTISGNGFYCGGPLIPSLNLITGSNKLFAAILASNTTGNSQKNSGTSGKHFGKLGRLSTIPNVFLRLKLSREHLFSKGGVDIVKNKKHPAA